MHNKLNILMISHHRRYKTTSRSKAMAQHLVQKGHQVTLIVTSDYQKVGIVETEWDGVYVVETPDLLWGRLRSGWDLWNLLNRVYYLNRDKRPYNLVHCFETRPATIYPALFYTKRHNIPLITDWNDFWGRGGLIQVNRPYWYRILFGWIETYYEEAFRTLGSGTTVISSALKQRAVGLGLSQEDICYIPGGASPDLYLPRTIEECRKRIGFSSSELIICFTSTDSYYDLEIVIAALKIVVQDYPDAKLIVTGHANKAIRDLPNKYGVIENVIFTGYLPLEELPWHMGCANLFILPFPDTTYNVGRWPNKICDYMCLERPTVSNPVGDIKELFENNKIGVLAEWEPEDFAQKIIYLFTNPDIATQFGKEARTLAITQYQWSILTDKLEEFYFKVLNKQVKSGK